MVLQLDFGVKKKKKLQQHMASIVKLGLDTFIKRYHVPYKLSKINLD
jgi:hypothetical protein